MEPWQRAHIKNNLSGLLSNTLVNPLLLAELKKDGMLSEYDAQAIESEKTNFHKANLVYEILATKNNGYRNLVRALKETSQSGALKTLRTISTDILGNLQIEFIGQIQTLKNLFSPHVIKEIQNWIIENLSADEFSKILEHLCSDQIDLKLLRETIPPEYSRYIPRMLSRRHTVDTTLFERPCTDVFVFKDIKLSQLRQFVRWYAIESSTSQLLQRRISARFIILDTEAHWEKIRDKIDNPTHFMRYESQSKRFLIEATSGISNEVRFYLKDASNPEFISENAFVEQICARGVCICDAPGMGKSLLLGSIARKTRDKYPDHVVAFIQLRDLFTSEDTPTRDNVKSILFDYTCTSRLASFVLQELLKCQHIKFELFFDGLDEVKETQLVKMTSFLSLIGTSMHESTIYVSSRPVVREELERSIGAIAYDIVPFNDKTQRQYVISYWLEKANNDELDMDRLNEYSDACLQDLKAKLKPDEVNITGIPLLCKLLAEVYAENAIIYADKSLKNPEKLDSNFINSLPEVYSKFILSQLGESMCNFECMLRWETVSCSTQCKVKSLHVWRAIQVIFPNMASELSKWEQPAYENLGTQTIFLPGLLENRQNRFGTGTNLEFVHRTLAEFLVAEYFATALFAGHEATPQHQRLQQLAFDEIFALSDNTSLLPHTKIYVFKLREQTVSYFLDSLLTFNRKTRLNILCKINHNFWRALLGCLLQGSDGLLEVYLKAIETNPEGFDDLNVKKILMIAAVKCSLQAVKMLCTFWLKNFYISLTSLEYSHFESPIELAARHGKFELTEYFADIMPLGEIVSACLYDTYFENEKLIDRKLDILQMLEHKRPDLLSNSGMPSRMHLKAIRFLIERKVNFRTTDEYGKRFLYDAAIYMFATDFIELCQVLDAHDNSLDNFLDPNTLNLMFLNHQRLSKGKTEETEALLKILQYLSTKRSSIHAVRDNLEICANRLERLKTFLNVDFCKMHKEHVSILFYAAIIEEDLEVADLLHTYDPSLVTIQVKRRRCDLIRRRCDQIVPIIFAMEGIDFIKFLVDRGASIFDVDEDGRTILHFLLQNGPESLFIDVVKYCGTLWEIPTSHDAVATCFPSVDLAKPTSLLELFNWPDKLHRTPLHYGLHHYLHYGLHHYLHYDKLDMFLTGGKPSPANIVVNVNAIDKEGNTPLHTAVIANCNLYIIKRLVKHDAEFTMKNKTNCNLTHISAQRGFADHLKYFVELGIDVNEIDSMGNNALQCGLANFTQKQFSREKNIADTVKFLVDAGVNKFHVNSKKETAYIIAKQKEPDNLLLHEMLKVDNQSAEDVMV